MEARGAFRRGVRSRILHFLYLVPLLIGFRPLLVRFDWPSFVLYSSGCLFLLVLILVANRNPYILFDEDALHVQLEYKEDREIHRYEEILGYYQRRPGVIELYSLEHKPLVIRIGRRDSNRFKELMHNQGIQPTERKVAHGKA